MPFRKLPNTDEGRLQALEKAFDKAASTPAGQLAISAATKTRLDAEYPVFRDEMAQRGGALAEQGSATEAQDHQASRLYMWTSHFYQNLNMGIDRGVFPASVRAYYQMDLSQTAIPSMSNEADLMLWSGRVGTGEAARVAAGGTALPFPSAAEVTTERNQFQTLRNLQSAKKDAYDSEQEDVQALRAPTDELIRDIWDEVEFFYRHETPSSLRNKAREYGVYYATRPGEPTDPGSSLAAPTNVMLTLGPANVLFVHWDLVTGADSYEVRKQLVGTDPDFVLAGTSTAANLSFGSFSPGAVVRVKVRALHGTTASLDSPVVQTTISPPGP